MSRIRRPTVLVLVENVPLARDHRLRKQTASLVAAGYEVHVICRRDPDNGLVDGVVVHDYPAPPDAASKWGYVREYGVTFLWAALLTARLSARTRVDVVQVCGAPDIWFPIAGLLRRRGAKVVYDQRDPSPELFDARYGTERSPLRPLLVSLERATHAVSDRVLTVNRSLAATAVSRGGHDEGRVRVVGNGPVLASVARSTATPPLSLEQGSLCVWHGMMGPQDRLDLVVLAAAHVVHDLGRTDCRFVLLGDGEARGPAEQLVVELGLQDHVRFTGWVPEAHVFAILAYADIGIESNTDPLVSPVKVMEYMAFGIPVVAFDVLETRRLAEGAAVYAAPRDAADLGRAVSSLLDDAAKRDRLGEVGRRRVEDEVAWDHQAATYLAVYREVLEPAHPRLTAISGPDPTRGLPGAGA